MVVKTSINQPERYQGDSTSSKYINKVTLSADGTLSVVATPIAKSNLLPAVTTTTPKPTTTNQIVSNTKSSKSVGAAPPKAITSDGDGIVVNPQPPGPPGVNSGV